MKRGLKVAVGFLVAPLVVAAVAVIWIAAHTHGPAPSALAVLRAHLATAPAAQHEAIVAAALLREGELPWRTGTTLTFLAQEAADVPPRVIGDFNGWPEATSSTDAGRMERLGGSAWYALEATVLPRARIEYLIAHGERSEIDPRNPKHLPGVGGEVSEVRLAGCFDAPELAPVREEAPAGKIAVEERSDASGRSRRVAVYTPAGYDPARGPYPLVVFHDGSLMLEQGGMARVLDRLIGARRVVPLVAVFVDPTDRAADYSFDAAWRAWFTGELLPDIARRFAVASDPAHRAVIGVSRGAVGAVDLARSGDAAIGFCGLLMPATQPVPVADALRAGPALARLRVTAVLALYDAQWLDDGRRLVDILRERGATVESVEVPEGHGVETWRRHVGMLLERFAPGPRATH